MENFIIDSTHFWIGALILFAFVWFRVRPKLMLIATSIDGLREAERSLLNHLAVNQNDYNCSFEEEKFLTNEFEYLDNIFNSLTPEGKKDKTLKVLVGCFERSVISVVVDCKTLIPAKIRNRYKMLMVRILNNLELNEEVQKFEKQTESSFS